MAPAGPGFRAAPVEEGKTYDVTIEDVGREGDGLARIDNFVVFVAGTKVGDKVKVRVTKVLRRMAIAEVVTDEADGG